MSALLLGRDVDYISVYVLIYGPITSLWFSPWSFVHITRWCNVTSHVLLFWSSQPSCQSLSVLVSCLVYVYTVNTSCNLKVNKFVNFTRCLCLNILTSANEVTHLQVNHHFSREKQFTHSFWVTLTSDNLLLISWIWACAMMVTLNTWHHKQCWKMKLFKVYCNVNV